jgi:hypothetical protein
MQVLSPEFLHYGTFAESRNAGGSTISLRKGWVADAVSILSRPLLAGRALQVLVDFVPSPQPSRSAASQTLAD